MSRSIEDLVRAAQHEQAERAVDPRRILAALPQRRAQVVRRRRFVLAVAAAAAVAVAAVPVLVLGQGPAPQPPSVTPTPSPSPSVSVTDTRFVPLRFSPGWLPPGYAEYFRTIQPPGGVDRLWAPAAPKSPFVGELPGRLTMNVVAQTEDSAVDREDVDETVEINGSSGAYSPVGRRVYWQVDGHVIQLWGEWSGLSKETLLRVARSVRPDPAVLEVPFELPLPAGQAFAGHLVMGASPGKWLARTDLGEGEPDGSVAAVGTWVSIGTMTDAPKGGTALRVAGRPARHLSSEVPEGGYYLVVDLGGGLLLTVFSMDLDRPAMIALAETAGAPNPAAVGWIGR